MITKSSESCWPLNIIHLSSNCGRGQQGELWKGSQDPFHGSIRLNYFRNDAKVLFDFFNSDSLMSGLRMFRSHMAWNFATNGMWKQVGDCSCFLLS